MAPEVFGLNNLRIAGFRGIREGGLSDLGAINILCGPNGSGKSSVLDAIYLMASQFSENAPIRYHERYGGGTTSRAEYLRRRSRNRKEPLQTVESELPLKISIKFSIFFTRQSPPGRG